MKKVGLFVGNGFTRDFTDQLDLSSSKPLHQFGNSKINYDNFIDYFPTIRDELLISPPENDDFKEIEKYISKYKYGSKEECELRKFLVAAYSSFQLAIDEYSLFEWKWVKWLQRNRTRLSCAISFNYDVLLERALKFANIPYSRIGTSECVSKVPILKPHGSIDFDIKGLISGLPVDELWRVTTSLNDIGLPFIVPKQDWLLPRMEADIIPPSMHNIQLKLSWIHSMLNEYIKFARNLDAFVIVGISYWDVDRPEIDFFLNQLPKKAKVYIMNPNPNPDLIQKITSLELDYDILGFDDLPW
ncbi:hypothetical protein [Bacillus cereus group sp. IBL03679]|uniref:hypothetical protein n=1 Tax=Bacillus cereus group sp. IBL03679 TaxID=3240095 RepID=UPI003D2F71C7